MCVRRLHRIDCTKITIQIQKQTEEIWNEQLHANDFNNYLYYIFNQVNAYFRLKLALPCRSRRTPIIIAVLTESVELEFIMIRIDS